MSQDWSLTFWTRLIAVAFVTTGPLLHADDPPASSDGYKTVPVTLGDKTVPIRVREAANPYKNVSTPRPTGKYDPTSLNFSATSSFANKQFAPSPGFVTKSNSADKNPNEETFLTKTYVDDSSSPSAPHPDTSTSFPTTSAYSRNATGFNKTYSVANADLGPSRTAPGSSTTSADQDRAAVLGGPEKTEVLASDSMTHKQYLGPGAQHVPDGFVIKENIVLSRMSGLPNRPLSIDEVRNLINHETKPDTDVKPDEPSKPLNDPDYKPEPLRDNPSPGPVHDDDKIDSVPAPGTMAVPPAPENSEPLPQR